MPRCRLKTTYFRLAPLVPLASPLPYSSTYYLACSHTFGIAVSSLQELLPDSLLGHPDQALYITNQTKWTYMLVNPCEADR